MLEKGFIHVTYALPQIWRYSEESCQNPTLSLPQPNVKKLPWFRLPKSKKNGVVLETGISLELRDEKDTVLL